ncbi:MAG: membrane-bound lytic murein transglycosylase MltF [Marinagarivorans sp.]|nr:membrane-bound lytic murein transglycosylase MltF [Marinagarivorans sp.]
MHQRFITLSLIIRALLNHAWVVSCTVVLCLLVGPSVQPNLLERIKASGTLIVASRNGPTTYYEHSEGLTGFDYEIVKGFADSLGLKLDIIDVEDLGHIFHKIQQHKVHMGAAGLTITPKRRELVDFSIPYLQVTQKLIYRANTPKPQRIEDIIGGNILVIANSSHAERLRQLKRSHPDLSWQEQYDIEMLDLLEMINNDKVEYAVVDSNALDINSSVYPRALAAFDISEPEALAWALPKTSDTSLLDAANSYLRSLQSSGRLAEITDSFYGHVGHVDYSGALVFTKRVRTRLPKWQALLKEAAAETQLDWQLLAALSYQESHWDPTATSKTGVRGFMMLTRNTAKSLGVTDRTHAKQSIFGGARYFRKMYDRLSGDISEPDRTWFALAAYNIGFFHLEDARKLTQDQGANPNLWSDVKERLPLLTKRQYYKKTRYGYARGHEAITYVNNIRNFFNVIAWKEQERLKQEIMANDETTNDKYESIISSALEELDSLNAL